MENTELLSIDKEITEILDRLDNIADKLEWEELPPFTLSEDTNIICGDDHSYSGLYLFEIKHGAIDNEFLTWLNNFAELWDDGRRLAWVPRTKQIRLNAHRNLQVTPWTPLYIGKSRNITNRVNEHLLKSQEKTTFAMKLKARPNMYGQMFRVKVLRLQATNYNVLAPYLENKFRNIWHPITGRQ